MQVAPLDLQVFGRAGNIPVMFPQLSRDVFLFERIAGILSESYDLVKSGCAPWSTGSWRYSSERPCNDMEACGRVDDRARHHDHQSFDQIPQFADIARPVILLKHGHASGDTSLSAAPAPLHGSS